MSWPLVLAGLWVLAATATALLPLRRQMLPGGALLIAAPFLIYWVAVAHGALAALIGAYVFLSMFRKPLWHLMRKVMGETGP